MDKYKQLDKENEEKEKVRAQFEHVGDPSGGISTLY